MPFHIAIDGPVAAGKGTVSRLVAQRLGFLYVDTGAMYRTTALIAFRNKVSWEDEEGITQLLKEATIDMRNPTESEKDGRLTTVLLDEKDVSWEIRTEKMSQGSSKVAVLPEVRKLLVKKQQIIAENKDVVMEGRDITTRVLPEADLKIFLTASDLVRAKRRHVQMLTKGLDISFEEVFRELKERDQRDQTRRVDPLQVVDDALVIDTSDLGIEKVVEVIVSKVTVLRE